jgi:hypothetical protein
MKLLPLNNHPSLVQLESELLPPDAILGDNQDLNIVTLQGTHTK